MKLIDAVKQVLDEDPRAREAAYGWLFLAKTLRVMGFKIFIEFSRKMPSPETIFRERREIINKRGMYSKEFMPEEGVTYERKD